MAERKLTTEQKRAALQAAKAAGLCDGWHVEWDNRRKSKVWIAPGGVKTCWSLPQAVAWQVKVGIVEPSSVSTELAQKLHRRLTDEEVNVARAEARRKGLPEGWRLEYDNRRGCKAWISPCGSRRCYTVGKAVAWSLEKGLVRLEQLPPAQKAMSEEEVAAAKREAKERGLSDEWEVEWNYRKGIRVWICPETSKRCFSIAEALRKQNNDGGDAREEAKSQAKQPVKPGKGSPTDLPPGWTIEWDEAAKRNVFLSPCKDKKCHSIKEVLAWSLKNGLFRDGTSRSSVQKKAVKSQLTEEEKRKALKLAKSQGLGDGWTVEWDKKSMQRVWYAPNRRKKCQSLPEALAWASKHTTPGSEMSRGEPNHTSARPDSPKSEKTIPSDHMPQITTSPSTKRSVEEDIEIALAIKRQKLDSAIGASNLLALASSPSPIQATSCPSSAITHHAPNTLLGGLQYNLAPVPSLAFGTGPSTSAHDLLSRSIFAGTRRASLPPASSLPLSAHTTMLSPTTLGLRRHHSNELAQDILALRRSEQLLASRALVQREVLLDAALRGSSFPNSLSHSPFLG